jgi:hypothetical protein
MTKIKLRANFLNFERGDVIEIYDFKRTFDFTDDLTNPKSEVMYGFRLKPDGDFIYLNKEMFEFMVIASNKNV